MDFVWSLDDFMTEILRKSEIEFSHWSKITEFPSWAWDREEGKGNS